MRSCEATVYLKIGENNSFGIQHILLNRIFTVTVLSGTFEADNATLNLDLRSDHGTIYFTANSTATLNFTIPNGIVQINGTSVNNTSLNSGDYIILFYQFFPETPWLPVRLGLGILGFGLLVVCPIMMVKKLQDKEYEKVLFPWFIALILGGALIVGWLFPLGYG